jgi:hypothetical protein
MSEVKLNLIDAQSCLIGTIHGSAADSCVAALSAEPETIAELETALGRYIRPHNNHGPFASFRFDSDLDAEPWDAGLVIIDLAARIVSVESSYSQPLPEGTVNFHDGTELTDVVVSYCLPADWLFVSSVEAYRWSRPRRRQQRATRLPLDTRAVLYGPPLLDFIANSGIDQLGRATAFDDEAKQEALAHQIKCVHAAWLVTPRLDLRGRSPREVLLEKLNLIDADMESRCWQWSMQNEGPPCLSTESFAYRFAGFGTHEWVVYYDLVRYLLWRAAGLPSGPAENNGHSKEQLLSDTQQLSVPRLEELKRDWLEQPQTDYDGKVPIIIIENERKRLPQAMSPAELIIDDDCDLCRMSALEAEMGFGPGFWHLDGCNMEDEFAFSTCLTLEEWEAEQREHEKFDREFNRKWTEDHASMTAEELLDDTAIPEAPF